MEMSCIKNKGDNNTNMYICLDQGSYRQEYANFKDFSRTYKGLSYCFQGLKTNGKYFFTCKNSTLEMLDCFPKEIG